jgi:FkbM family methyltransferase
MSRAADVVRIRANRLREVRRADAWPGLRRELLTVDYALPLRRRRGREELLPLHAHSDASDGTLYFGRDSFAVDRVAYFGIFLDGWYRADFRGATVIDVGGHKGYFGAFALLSGAASVRSFEPESANFAALDRAVASFGGAWQSYKAAVGSVAGTANLRVNTESAGHSILDHEDVDRPTRGIERVDVVAMADILAGAGAVGPLIVKIDAEGAEADIVLGTPAEAWSAVDHVFLEVHDFAPCSTEDIIGHLAPAGLTVTLREADALAQAELVALAR